MDECDEGKDNEGKFTENERWKNLGNFLFSVIKMGMTMTTICSLLLKKIIVHDPYNQVIADRD